MAPQSLLPPKGLGPVGDAPEVSVRSRHVPQALQFQDIVLDWLAHSVVRRGHEVRLGPLEFRMLGFLMLNAGRVLSRHELVASVWSNNAHLGDRTVDVYVARLRKALTQNRGRDPIRTVRGEGYALGDKTDSVRAILPSPAGSPSSLQSFSCGGVFNPANYRATVADPGILSKSHLVTGFELDRATQRVRRLGRDLHLSPREFQLLDLLISSPGKIFSRKQIVETVCGDSRVGVRTADAMVVRLRKAINQGFLADPIRTVLKVGYKFNELFEERHSEGSVLRPKKLHLRRRR